MKTRILRSGAEMPVVGLGTWTLRGDQATEAVETALELGYRHIDTAEAYNNQSAIARGIRRAGVPREELFIVSKVQREHLHYEEVLAAADKTLDELHTDYLDLYLIHWPNPRVPMRQTFTALGELHKEGKIRDVGVSNFSIAHLQEAFEATDVPISNNQVPYDPIKNQEELRQFCHEHGITVTAYSPLGKGDLVDHPQLKELAADRERTVAQLILRWLVEKDLIVIPRSTSREHLAEDIDLFGWELDDEVRAVLEGMSQS